MMESNGTCQTLCVVPDVTGEQAKFINDRIREDYALNWLIDGLPAAEMKIDTRNGDLFFDMGFNLGNDDPPLHEMPALNNHYEIVLRCVHCRLLHTVFADSFQISPTHSRTISCCWCPCMAFQVFNAIHLATSLGL